MSDFSHDVRYAFRTFLSRPSHAIATVITIVLGISATTAVFSVVNGVLLRPLPYDDPDQLVLIYEVDQRSGTFEDHNPVAAANFADWRDQNRVFDAMANFAVGITTVYGEAGPERLSAAWADPDLFKILRTRPVAGRAMVTSDGDAESERVVLIGHQLWQRRFGGDSAAVGTVLNLGNRSATIVGVMPPGLKILDRSADIWIPWILSERSLQNRRTHSLRVAARMSPGVTKQDAQADLDRVVAGLRDIYPEYLTGWGVNVESMTDEVIGSVRPALLVLLAAVGFVLLTATVNLANLLLTRSLTEQRPTAIRAALGAGGVRLIRLKLVESGLVGVAGVALGIPAAYGAIRVLLTLAPEQLPRTDQIGIDGGVLMFAVGITAVTSLLAGLFPALRAASTPLVSELKEGGRGTAGAHTHQRLRAGFAVTQLAFSLMLLVSAGLMLSTFARLIRVDSGFEPRGVATAKLTLPFQTYGGTEEQRAFFDELLPRVAAVPGVQRAAVTIFLPMQDGESTWSVQVLGKPDWREGEKRDYGWHAVSVDYFRAMGIQVLRGRGFTEFDRHDVQPVVIVNQAFVRRFFAENENPIGQQMFVITTPDSTVREIVGIVEDVRHYALDADPEPSYYMPYSQAPVGTYWLGQMNLVLQTTGEPAAVLRSGLDAVRAADRDVLVTNTATMQQHLSRSVARTRFAMVLLNTFAGVALVLAVVGIYGVIAYAISERRPEIGIRLALGAQPAQVVGSFVASGVKLIVAGLSVGILAAMLFTRLQASLLFGVDAVDPLTYGVVAVGFGLVAVLATYLPARRASRVDPMSVLREEEGGRIPSILEIAPALGTGRGDSSSGQTRFDTRPRLHLDHPRWPHQWPTRSRSAFA